MSLVGSEVSISRIGNNKKGDSKEAQSSDGELHVDGLSLSEDSHPYSPTAVSADDENDYHRSLSPPRPAEELFMGSKLLEGRSTISATALAQQLHQHHLLDASSRGTLSVATDDFHSLVSRFSLRAGSSSRSSVATDDFQSAYSNEQHFVDFTDPTALVSSLDDSDDPLNNTSESSVFERDALSRGDLYSAESPPRFHDTQQENNMTDSTTTTKVDPAEKIYENAKGIWAWGKGIVVFKPFLGIAEGVAGKVVSMVGSSMEDVDSKVTEKLHGLDDGILNPAIAAVVSTLLGAAHSTEDFVKPIIMTLLKPIDFLIKNKAENSDPEVTTPTAAAAKPTTTRVSAM